MQDKGMGVCVVSMLRVGMLTEKLSSSISWVGKLLAGRSTKFILWGAMLWSVMLLWLPLPSLQLQSVN